MAESKKNLKIRFEGRLDNLVINYGGKVLYSYKREKKRETGKTDKQKAAQAKTAITAALCSQINQIPALKYIWKKWPDKERKPYRNMLAANMRHTSPEHLTIHNIISPKSQYEYNNFCKSVTSSELDIRIGSQEYSSINTENGKTFSIIVIICFFNPKDKSKESYKLLTLCKEIENFDQLKTYNIKFQIDPEKQKEFKEYRNCIIYNTVLFSALTSGPQKWYSAYGLEFELNKGEEGGKKI
jgi:hypothetical protein